MEPVLYIACGIGLLLTVIVSARTGKFWRNMILSSVLGVCVLLLCVFFGKKIGICANLNPVTALLSVVGGVPGAVFSVLLGIFI